MQNLKCKIQNSGNSFIFNFDFLPFISRKGGFTLLELLIVLSLIVIILAISAAFFANTLPSSRFNATVREMSAAIRQAGSLARMNGGMQTITIDLDANLYLLEGRGSKGIPGDIRVKFIDPVSGEISKGRHSIVFYPGGGLEGGTIVLSTAKKTASIMMDPVVGSVVIK